VQHLIDNEHSIGPIENIMDIVQTTSKGRMFDTMEKKQWKINKN
jgi:hypothetical protein